MSAPVNPIFLENKLDRGAKKLKLVLHIPVITYPDGDSFFSETELTAHANNEMEAWSQYLTEALVDEPIRRHAWRAIASLAMQCSDVLAWEARKKGEISQLRFYETVSELYAEALDAAIEDCEEVSSQYTKREIELDEVSRRAVGVDESYRVKNRKGKGVLRRGAPRGLEDIPEE